MSLGLVGILGGVYCTFGSYSDPDKTFPHQGDRFHSFSQTFIGILYMYIVCTNTHIYIWVYSWSVRAKFIYGFTGRRDIVRREKFYKIRAQAVIKNDDNE